MQLRVTIKGTPLSKYLSLMPFILKEYRVIKEQSRHNGGDFPFGDFYPCFEDRSLESGTTSGHYFHQDLLIAQKIYQNNPVRHVDIGSRVDGFIAHLAAFRKVEVLDIRNLTAQIDNISFRQVDLMDPELNMPDYCDSLSCLHALEHFGLGRYGDKIDYDGHLKGWRNLHNMLKKRGKFYFSVPIGEQRIEFNAHRIFSLSYLMKMIDDRYQIDSFSYVNDAGKLVKNVELSSGEISNNFSCHYGLGIFELTKL